MAEVSSGILVDVLMGFCFLDDTLPSYVNVTRLILPQALAHDEVEVTIASSPFRMVKDAFFLQLTPIVPDESA